MATTRGISWSLCFRTLGPFVRKCLDCTATSTGYMARSKPHTAWSIAFIVRSKARTAEFGHSDRKTECVVATKFTFASQPMASPVSNGIDAGWDVGLFSIAWVRPKTFVQIPISS
jgi:hypothetical protein